MLRFGDRGCLLMVGAAGGVTVPAAPTGLAATAISATRIDLAWTDNATNETEYRVYRSIDGVTYALIDTIAAGSTSYSNTGLTVAVAYWYKIAAANAAGEALSAAAGPVLPALWLTATTTGASQAVTLDRMTPATGKTITVVWGDGGANTVIAAGDTASKSHTYAAAGTYAITITDARDIVQIDLHDARLSGFDSAQLAGSAIQFFACYSLGSAVASRIVTADMVAWSPTDWRMFSMPAGTYSIDSADMAAWSPLYWRLYSMPAGAYSIDSADMVAWSPDTWYLFSMPAGAYSIDSADMVAWSPTDWRMFSMPAGTYSIDSADMAAWSPLYWRLSSMSAGTLTVTAAANFNGWVRPAEFRFDNLTLNQTQVDAILTGLYGAFAAKTSTGGTLNLGGSGATNNAAPTGTFQAASGCPPTDGKEIAYELLNDTCGISTKHWATVTITA